MVPEIKESALEFFSNPKAAQVFIDKYNLLCKSHNNLCLAHDQAVEELKEISQLVDTLVEIVFPENTGELDS